MFHQKTSAQSKKITYAGGTTENATLFKIYPNQNTYPAQKGSNITLNHRVTWAIAVTD